MNEQRRPSTLTAEQRAALEAELAELEGPRRREAIEAIARAREFGDIAENFEYHAAKNEQGLLEARITMLKDRLHHAVTVEHETDDHVGVGSIVEVEDEDGETMEVEISAVGGVSPDSPLGSALDGRGGRRRRRRGGAERVVEGPRRRDQTRLMRAGHARAPRLDLARPSFVSGRNRGLADALPAPLGVGGRARGRSRRGSSATARCRRSR